MGLRAILFDLGGTLLHYHDRLSDDPARPFRRVTVVGIEAVLERLAASGAPLPPGEELVAVLDRRIAQSYQADWQAQRGGSIEPPLRAGLAETGIALSDEQWASLRPALYGPMDAAVFPREGLHETLTALREAGYLLGVISNTHWAADVHDRHLAEQGLLDHLPLRIYSCDTPYMKPHSGIFHMALEALGVAPEEAAYVGDRPDVDVEGAQQAGLYGVLIDSPYRTEFDVANLDGVTPDAVISELPELIPALDGLGAART